MAHLSTFVQNISLIKASAMHQGNTGRSTVTFSKNYEHVNKKILQTDQVKAKLMKIAI